MDCRIKNITAGRLYLPEGNLNRQEEKRFKFTERVRYYIAVGYLQLVELYSDMTVTGTSARKQPRRKSKKQNKEGEVK